MSVLSVSLLLPLFFCCLEGICSAPLENLSPRQDRGLPSHWFHPIRSGEADAIELDQKTKGGSGGQQLVVKLCSSPCMIHCIVSEKPSESLQR